MGSQSLRQIDENARAAADGGGAPVRLADLKRALRRFQADNMTDHAASLTYFGLLSLFPGLLFAVSVLGLFGERSLVADATQYLRDAGAPPETIDSVTSSLDSAVQAKGTAGVTLVAGLGAALWGASGYFGAAGRALNVVWRVEEGRGAVRRKLGDLAWTLVVLVLILLTLVLLFLGGGLAEDVLGAIGLGQTAAEVWLVARWPGALATALLVYAVLYFAAPNVRVRRFQYVTPGAVLGVGLWLAASAGFFLYVSNFGSYEATYGAFAGAVILLVWLWITNIVLLLGAELNATIRVRRTPELPETYEGPPLPAKETADD